MPNQFYKKGLLNHAQLKIIIILLTIVIIQLNILIINQSTYFMKAPVHQDALEQEYAQSDRSFDNVEKNDLNQLKSFKSMILRITLIIILILVMVIAYLLYSTQTLKKELGQLTNNTHDFRLQNMNTIQRLETQFDEANKDNINKPIKKQIEVAQRLRDVNIQLKNTNLHKPKAVHFEHEQLTFPYDTMGMKKNEKFWNEVVKESEYYQFQQSFFDFLKPYNDTTCELERLGGDFDGGYPICTNLLNHSKGLINLGINGAHWDTFGCVTTSRQKMPNFQYDCTNGGKPICETNNNNNVFTLACLNQRTQKSDYQYYSMKEMIDRGNLAGKNFILKMDIEGGQWQGFKTFPIQYLKLADQIVMELHLPGPALSHIKLRWGYLQIMKTLQSKLFGYVTVNKSWIIKLENSLRMLLKQPSLTKSLSSQNLTVEPITQKLNIKIHKI